LIAAGLCAGLALAWCAPHLLADETYYGPQVRLFMEGRFELVPGITMIPAYHLVVASIAQIFGPYSDRLARATSFLGTILFVVAAWRLASEWCPDAKPTRVVQAVFQPLLFPYLFLIYTEAWSLAALAAMLVALARRRFWIAAGAGAIGVLIRQDFVIWVAMAFTMATVGGLASFDLRKSWRGLIKSAVEASPLLLVLLGFAGFVAWNGGVALGDRASHQSGMNVTNLYFMLICGWVVFLPVAVDCLPEIRDLVRQPRVALALAAAFALYMATYSNLHIYNQEHLRFFVHNEVLHWMTHRPWVRAILFVPLAWMLLACVVVARKRPMLRIPMLFAAVSVALHPLIEQRYYLPAFLLLNLGRAPISPRLEATMVVIYIPVALALLYGMVSERFFL
jgi:alpha-1,2-glucosyltransferase